MKRFLDFLGTGLFGVPMPFILDFVHMLVSGLIGEAVGASGALFYSFIPGSPRATRLLDLSSDWSGKSNGFGVDADR